MPALRRTGCFLFLFLLVTSFLKCAQAGTFKNPGLIETTYDPIGVATSDLNHDGNADLVYVDGVGSPALHVLLGDGKGTFTHGEDTALPAGACGYLKCVINFADVNTDGIPDIVLGGSGTSNQIIVMVGKGDGTFQQPILSSVYNSGGQTPSLNCLMGIGDINGDGAVDLVIPDPASARLYILLGNNTGKFTLSSALTIYFTGSVSAYLIDLNGDGYLDAVVNDEVAANTYVFLGNGNGTFKTQVVYQSFALLLADMDNDGHPDLVADVYPGMVKVLKGNPDGTFGAAAIVTTVASTDFLIATGDYNGDSTKDLVFLNPAGVGIALAKGNLTYGSEASSLAGNDSAIFSAAGGITTADFNNDGYNDIALGGDGGIVILLGNGDGTFISGDFYDVGHQVGTVAVADFNADKNPDIAVTVAASYPRILLGNGKGTFTLAADQNQSYLTQGQSTTMFAGDFNGDGKPDLDIAQMNTQYPWGQTFILFDGSAGIFASPLGLPIGSTLVADLNNDGRSDVVAMSGNIVSMLGQANGGFLSVSTPPHGPGGVIAAVGDINHDGKQDLIIAGYPNLELWLGNGDGSFTYNNSFGSATGPASGSSAAIADLDGDGNGDLILAPYLDVYNPDQSLAIYYGNGDGTFQAPVMLPLSHLYTKFLIADINRDNKPDFVLTDGNGIAVIENMGSRVFDQEQHYVAGENITGIAVADVNGDGFPDIVAANGNGTTVAVLLNQPNGNSQQGAQSNGVFAITPEPANYAQPVTLSLTMSAPPGSGLATPTGTASFNVDGALLTTVTLASGKASYLYSATLAPGTHTFVATYNGDQTYSPTSFSLLHSVQDPVYTTKTALVASPSSLLTSQTVRLTATVTSPAIVQAGVVTFMDGSAPLGAQTVDLNGVALLDTATLSPGTHSIKAIYQGYQSYIGVLEIFTPSTSPIVTVTVNDTVTTTTLSASNTSPTVGTVVTFTANVASLSGAPFGGVTFYDGASLLGTSSLQANGSTTFSTASLSVGAHNITAAFNANATFGGSISPGQSISVIASGGSAARTVVSLSAENNVSPGKTVLIAKVGGLTSSSGSVTFLDAGAVLGAATTDMSGTAKLSVPALASGTHSLTASFAGNLQFAASVSPVLQEQWPEGGPDFSLSTSDLSVSLSAAGSQPIPVVAVPGASFHNLIALSCASGLPAGYICKFSPAALNEGGASFLQITGPSIAKRMVGSSHVDYALTLGLFSICFMGFSSRRRMRNLLLLAPMVLMIGCGNPSSVREIQQMKVLSVQAISGSGINTVVHSVQIVLDIPGSQH